MDGVDNVIFSVDQRHNYWYKRIMNYAPKTVPESMTASLARSEAQIAAGRTVPLDPVLDRLRSSIARMRSDEQPKLDTPEA